MVEQWFFLQSPAASAEFNMALDEALLRAAADRERPLLRAYSWKQPSVSIGYFQKFPAHLAGRYDIVRRPTGGGLVYHGDDTTYTVVAPARHWLSQMQTTEAYLTIHRAVAAALDVKSGVVDLPSRPKGEECFQNPVRGDVIADGRKLAGAAQRRTKWGLLHQGSIAASVSTERLCRGFHQLLGAEFRSYDPTADERLGAERLAVEKYSTAAWNKRS